MKFSFLNTSALALSIFVFTACNNTNTESMKDAANEVANTAETPDRTIKLVDFPASPEFKDAQLAIKDVKTEPQGKDSVKVTINYDVKGYELTKQTSSDNAGVCNNSKDGQHIHFILDNKPYAALYKPTHSFVVPINSKHYVMSFLSRSYHESLKNREAGVLLYFAIDDKGTYKVLDNPNTPMVFYSRPKGDYVGKDTKNILLDYYIYGGNLSADGFKVKATINGNTFTLDQWKPMFIQNAPMGGMKVKLELLDKDGKIAPGDNSVVERDLQLAEKEPVK
ncbi:MAG TPA: hypothetical protein PKX92_05950 [Edaphocola sp.]|nr:hypothetical protein [Edaphocola sp.]